MKTSLTVILGALSLAVILVTLLFMVQNNGLFTPNGNPSTNEDYQVKIIQFSSRNGWFCPGGVAMSVDFDVTIQNNGTQNITDLTLLIKRTGAPNDNETLRSIQTLNVTSGETVHIYSMTGTNVGDYSKEFYNCTFTATISLNKVILDERTIEITNRQF